VNEVPSLPARASERIAASLEAARLRRREREDVEAELAAHLEDGLQSGRDLDALLHEFGEPAAAGELIGRSVRRRRRARFPALRAARLFTIAIAIAYAGLFARLRLGAPERTWDSPAAAADAWRSEHASERAAFETVLDSMYTGGEDGRLTATGLRAFQAWKGKTDPSLSSIALEPAFFANAARRGEVRREFERFLRLAEDAGPALEVERHALLSDRGRALRFVALQIPLDRLAARRAVLRRTP
jgi:hypothetical protein